jgi:hypothetical protein
LGVTTEKSARIEHFLGVCMAVRHALVVPVRSIAGGAKSFTKMESAITGLGRRPEADLGVHVLSGRYTLFTRGLLATRGTAIRGSGACFQ